MTHSNHHPVNCSRFIYFQQYISYTNAVITAYQLRKTLTKTSNLKSLGNYIALSAVLNTISTDFDSLLE